jgi:hypothetical protein
MRIPQHKSTCCLSVILLLTLPSCVQDEDACGPDQILVSESNLLEYSVCACDESRGFVFDTAQGYGCRQCPEGQAPVAGSCSATQPDAATGDEDAGSDEGEPTEPTGVGEPCDSDADCAPFDAQFCALQTNTCLIDRCATGENDCGTGRACCDYSALLAGLSLCIDDADLNDGDCPMGGMRVQP